MDQLSRRGISLYQNGSQYNIGARITSPEDIQDISERGARRRCDHANDARHLRNRPLMRRIK